MVRYVARASYKVREAITPVSPLPSPPVRLECGPPPPRSPKSDSALPSDGEPTSPLLLPALILLLPQLPHGSLLLTPQVSSQRSIPSSERSSLAASESGSPASPPVTPTLSILFIYSM